MADNRIYLRCKNCGEAFFLGKRLIGGYFLEDYHHGEGKTPLERLNEFYDKHQWEDPKLGEWEVKSGWPGLDCFEIVYETDDDFNEKVTGFF